MMVREVETNRREKIWLQPFVKGRHEALDILRRLELRYVSPQTIIYLEPLELDGAIG